MMPFSAFRPVLCRCRSTYYPAISAVAFTLIMFVQCAVGQTDSATVLGRVTDQSGAVLSGAEVEIRDIDTNVAVVSSTDAEGFYVIHSLHPGRYVLFVRKQGFKAVSVTNINLNVQDNLVRNFVLQLGAVSESITVTADSEKINTTDGSVSTVVDRRFAEDLPMNGRSLQTLIQLTPGVVTTQSSALDGGQFSVNGQRANANYWMVDGVSANIGASTNGNAGNGLAGAVPAFGVLGGTNGLVSVDALQEFRIQTSTYAPEFGRSPGAQISLLTRSGTNVFHGTTFDYLRNDALDANDWFANRAGLPRAAERQNDFGGTFSGPLFKNRTFFFFSYEGLRLRLPQAALTTVPDLAARQSAIPAMQLFLDAYPLPNGRDLGNGIAQFNTSFSDKSSLDAYSLRIDHHFSRFSLFARYNYSPSNLIQRGFSGESLSDVSTADITIQTATVGTTYTISPRAVMDLRANYSRTAGSGKIVPDAFGGAVPFAPPFPNPFTTADSSFAINVLQLSNASIAAGKIQENVQRQLNIVDNVSVQEGRHGLKFGVDVRRLSPLFGAQSYGQIALFPSVSSAESGGVALTLVRSGLPATLLFHNLGVFAQDTWRAHPRLTLTYGLRWDVDFTPSSLEGPSLVAVNGFSLDNLSNLALAPAGTEPFRTSYNNFAPRLGIAYQLSDDPAFGQVVRGGFGVFYDLATQEAGNSILAGSYPFGASRFGLGGTFPLDATAAAPPAVTPASLTSGTLRAFDPSLRLPYTLQWNVSVEQTLGKQQSLLLTYLGSAGRRLIQTASVNSPNASFRTATLVTNAASSDYDALQIQFHRKLSRGFQALASYTWSHSIDTASGGSAFGNPANSLVPGFDPNINRGPSDFDLRHALSVGLTYDLPRVRLYTPVNKIINDWSIQTILQAHSAPPVNVFDSAFFDLSGASTEVRPDVVPGQPFYVYGTQFPGGKALNLAAFTDPPIDSDANPARQGNLGRNSLRASGASQWDLAVHRNIPLHESLNLEFRAEMFNVLNHPNFGPPISDLSNQSQFGQPVQMLGRSLVGVGASGSGAFSPLYQVGGPRSIQLALKLSF